MEELGTVTTALFLSAGIAIAQNNDAAITHDGSMYSAFITQRN